MALFLAQALRPVRLLRQLVLATISSALHDSVSVVDCFIRACFRLQRA
jgi:hypothetical protein